MSGNNVRRNALGDIRECARRCGSQIVVTERMLRSRAYYCGRCWSRITTESARRHPEVKRKNNRAYQSRHSGERAAAIAKWRANHPLKRVAHYAVQTALRNGSLIRGQCEVCGSPKTHAHHDDYEKPLEVRWLCQPHHVQHHQLLKAREAKS